MLETSGYPLFTLLMHVATMWVPPIFGTATTTDTSAAAAAASASSVFAATPAARANLLNAAFGAAAGAMVARTVVICVRDLGFSVFRGGGGKVDGNKAKLADWGAGAAAAAFYAFSPLVWLYASTAEVFALNNFLCALMLERAAAFAVSGAVADACSGAFAVGLALTNQHTAALFGLPLALWVLCALLPLIFFAAIAVGVGVVDWRAAGAAPRPLLPRPGPPAPRRLRPRGPEPLPLPPSRRGAPCELVGPRG